MIAIAGLRVLIAPSEIHERRIISEVNNRRNHRNSFVELYGLQVHSEFGTV